MKTRTGLLAAVPLLAALALGQTQKAATPPGPGLTEFTLTQVANYRFANKTLRVWASTRNSKVEPNTAQYVFEPAFVPEMKPGGGLNASLVNHLGIKRKVTFKLLFYTPQIENEVILTLRRRYPGSKSNITRDNVSPILQRQLTVRIPELSSFPACRLYSPVGARTSPTVALYQPGLKRDQLVSIICPTQRQAAAVLKNLPTFSIDYSYSYLARDSKRNSIDIQLKDYVNSDLYVKLFGGGSNAPIVNAGGNVYVHRDDLRKLTENISSNYRGDASIEDPTTFNQSFFERFLNQHTQTVTATKTKFNQEFLKQTYNADDIAPNIIEKYLNDLFEKRQTENRVVRKVNGKTTAKIGIPKILELGGGAEGSYNSDDFKKTLDESKVKIEYSGKAVIVKSVDIQRVNKGTFASNRTLRNVQSIYAPIQQQAERGEIFLSEYAESTVDGVNFYDKVLQLERRATALEGKKPNTTLENILFVTSNSEECTQGSRATVHGCRLVPVSEGMCFITRVGGDFFGTNEQLFVHEQDGVWYLQAAYGHHAVYGSARCFRAVTR